MIFYFISIRKKFKIKDSINFKLKVSKKQLQNFFLFI